MAARITGALTGEGIWGVEFFLSAKGVYFSELSPRPHDTGMVTLAGTQDFNEFELHLRAILGLPIPEILRRRTAANAVILATGESNDFPVYTGLEKAAAFPKSDFRIFGKPVTRLHRRMGIGLAYDEPGTSINEVRKRAKSVADSIHVNPEGE